MRKKSRTKSKEGGKVNFLRGGCLQLVVLFGSVAGLCFHIYKENILSICARNSPKIDTSGIAILRRKNKPEGGI